MSSFSMSALLLTTTLLASQSTAAPSFPRAAELRDCVASVLTNDTAQRIVVPSDPDYTDARLGEKIQDQQLPQMLAHANSIDEVGPLVKCAVASGVQPVPRSGGHDFEAFSALRNSLVIDLSHVNHVNISSDGSSVVVGAGIRLGALYEALDYAGDSYTYPGGICPTVGVAGYIASGGFNLQMRHLGLAADYIRSAKVVNAEGQILTASSSENEDLYWAIRGGGGGSYGIVVELDVALVKFPRSAMVALTWNDTTQRYPVAQRFLDWAPSTDPLFMSQVNVYKSKVDVLGWYYGKSQQDAVALMKSSGLLDIGEPLVQISGNCDVDNSRLWGYTTFECLPDKQVNSSLLNVVPQAFAPAYNNTPLFKWDEQVMNPDVQQAPGWPRFRRIAKSFFVQKENPIKNDTLEQVVDMIGQLDDASQVWGEWHAWNVSSGPYANNSFAWREQALAHLEFQIHGSTNTTQNDGYLAWMERLEKFLRSALGPASYPGYRDTTISVNPLIAYYGDNICGLIDVKSRYDPQNVFTNPLGVPPTVPGDIKC